MRLATWNVNSIRARLPRLLDWLGRAEIDVLALQETKVADAAFPRDPLEQLGYEVATHGLSQWNGVALLSRVGLAEVTRDLPGLPTFGDGPAGAPAAPEARLISATCAGIRVASVYVPNGRAVDDPHYHYKLAWLATVRAHVADELAAHPDLSLLVCGDFNIAPTDDDVWSVDYYRTQTHVTPPERAAFQALLDAGLADLARPFVPGPGEYTYWDYTQLAFPRRHGMRIDFALGSPALASRVTGAFFDRDERKGKGPSDHAPVVVEVGP